MANIRLRSLVFLFPFYLAVLAVGDESLRPLEHADYDRWNTIESRQVTNDGKWIMFTVVDGSAEPVRTVYIQSNGKSKRYKIERGSRFRFSHDSKYAIYQIDADQKLTKKIKKENAKAKPAELPQSRMELLELETGESFSVARVKAFGFPEENSDWLAYLMKAPFKSESVKEQTSRVSESYEVTSEGLKRPEKPLKLKKRPSEKPSTENSEKKTSAKEKEQEAQQGAESKKEASAEDPEDENAEKKEKDPGTFLVLRNMTTGEERRFPNVVRSTFSKFGDTFAFATSLPESDTPRENGSASKDGKGAADDSDSDGVYVFDLKKATLKKVVSGTGNYRDLTFNDEGSRLAFLTDKDDYGAKTSSMSLYVFKTGSKNSKLIAKEGTKGVPEGWWVSPTSSSVFSEDGRRLYFDTAPIPETVIDERNEKGEAAAKDEDDDKPKLDLWHWQDPLLQPQQLLQAQREKNRNYVAVYDLKSKKLIQLGDKDFPSVFIDRRSTANIAVGTTNLPYRKMLSWDIPGFQDSYVVDLKTGKRSKVLEKSKASASLSPEGKFVSWFDPESKKWFAASTGDDRTPVEISKGIPYPVHNELHDTPTVPRAYGSAGWTSDDEAFLVYDRFDIWKLDPTGKSDPVCLTNSHGREHEIRFRNVRLDNDARFVNLDEPLLLSALDDKTKASGFFELIPPDKEAKASDEASQEFALQKRIMLDESMGRVTKAQDSDDLFFSRSTFRKCPDLWATTLEFKKIHRLSDINPQQDEYLWGDVELVRWKASDGQDLDGLLYKPDGFDPDKKYPMIVYFYERNSDNLHRYYSPAAGRSIINFSFYVSRGYVVFVPDIPYKTGEPGPSAANAVLSGTQHIMDMGFIDKEKVGTQGHSWGGYQTAYLITQSDMFACAESGAPVSNMTSAYGGIRWGSGMSRMFQYERTQSRIGDTLWNAREKYIANSPLFFADKVNTPVLILHNDQDGAVPWYQGIEFFVALRRLEKPAWLLNYNDNPHWVMGQTNRRDFAMRMQQFFDHYLKDSPEPEWMAYGIPAVDKGEKLGLDLLEPPTEKATESEEEVESVEPSPETENDSVN